ncbi:aminotransferase class I/II-fold pyridoxal phosphate-dependent enzyme [Halobacteria archaeon AArc-dxtr1]|nr:aminotransferase class I/II-fold pyridoxal phosphate-dependent enzyme [Halobacteria archaeon AArc-dxtr1]
MEDRGFDLGSAALQQPTPDRRRTISPADRVAERGRFAPPADGSLPVLDADESLVFASDNYLGLTADERIQDAACQAATAVGTGAGASRTATGDTLVHHDLEDRLAEITDTERALSFSSRYTATIGTITALDPDVIFTDERNHASIADGCRLADATVVTYAHGDVDALDAALAQQAERAECDESWLIVTETVFGADGSVAPLAAICDAAESYGAWIVVDESHAVGLYAAGGGVVQAETLADRVDVQLGALSNALASQGGYVAGTDTLISHLLSESRPFTAVAGLAPTAAAAASEALHVARHEDLREQLWENVAHMRDGLESLGLTVLGDSQILCVLTGEERDACALADGLRERGIASLPICPPTTPTGASGLRLTPMATHTEGDIRACLEAIQAAGSEIGLY